MQKILTAEEMREVDRLTTEKFGIPSIILMENAAHAVARVITEKLGGSVSGKSFLILCGKGNNGGDGAALARVLWTQNAHVDVYLFGNVEETRGDARVNFEMLKCINIEETLKDRKWNDKAWEPPVLSFHEVENPDCWRPIATADVVIDAIFGTGLSRPIEDSFKKVVESKWFEENNFRPSTCFAVAIDIPSGLNADEYQQIGMNTRVDLTVTFTAPKIANVLPPASNFNGQLVVANIGSPQELIDKSSSQLFLMELDDAQMWLKRSEFLNGSYKNKRGHAVLIAGSQKYTGAAVLAANAAMVSGVGLTTVATSESAHPIIAERVLEEIITVALRESSDGAISENGFEEIEKLLDKADSVGIGCGLGLNGRSPRVSKGAVDNDEFNLVQMVVENRKSPVVIDADGLNALSPFNLKGSKEFPLILTPHEGEFLRLLGTENKNAIKDRVKAVRDFAEKHQVILVLKGERVLIGAPDGCVVVNPTGNSGLGKAGNGDALTGIITGFIAQAIQMKIDIFETVVAAVYIAGMAGDIAEEKFGKRSMLASDVRDCLVETFRRIEAEGRSSS